ncbi:MAG: hypothetical protein K2X06_15995 [Burkholderiales bacterium]|nr:hypothetical protein [Burkholderiales bacterium]
MHRVSPRPAGFALTATGISAVGLLSALIDGTLGWEYLAQELLLRLAH